MLVGRATVMALSPAKEICFQSTILTSILAAFRELHSGLVLEKSVNEGSLCLTSCGIGLLAPCSLALPLSNDSCARFTGLPESENTPRLHHWGERRSSMPKERYHCSLCPAFTPQRKHPKVCHVHDSTSCTPCRQRFLNCCFGV